MERRRNINTDKGDGKPYLDMLEEEYKKMDPEEKVEVDLIEKNLMKFLKLKRINSKGVSK